jgi:citrate lyase beta subunit
MLTGSANKGEERFSLFQLGFNGSNEIVELNGDEDFDLTLYGRMKYGDGQAATYFGQLLARRLIRDYGDQLSTSYVAASGFKFVPTAAHHVLNEVVAALTLMGHPPLGVFRIDRGVVAAVDYSTLGYAERMQSNSTRRVTLPDVSRETIGDRQVIVIDDVSVSGGTEAQTRLVLNAAGITKVLYAYLAMLPVVQDSGEDSSAREHDLTHSAVKRLADLIPIICSGRWKLNARTCKFILRADPAEVAAFVEAVPVGALRRILTGIVMDAYHLMPEHAEVHKVLMEAVQEHATSIIVTARPTPPTDQVTNPVRHAMHPALYTPATTALSKLADMTSGKMPLVRRLVICTEDSVSEQDLPVAIQRLALLLPQIDKDGPVKVFIRPRNYAVLAELLSLNGIANVTGFVLPKVGPKYFGRHAEYILRINPDFRIMPILESGKLTDPYFRSDLLGVLIQPAYKDSIDCVRLGGNDLLLHQGLRRDDSEFTIYDVIGGLLDSIVNEFRGNGGFAVTAPVFGFYGEQFDRLFLREVQMSMAKGLFGQTVIHPRHLPMLAEAYKVRATDAESAHSILATDAPAVIGRRGKMDECATDRGWAEAVVRRAQLFGTK